MNQVITVWEPGRRLEFRMVDTDLLQRRFIEDVTELFDLEAVGDGHARATRTTKVVFKLRRYWSCPFLKVGLKTVHRFVFRNWSISYPS